MLRTSAQNKIVHALFGDFARSWAYEGVRLTAAEWKIILCSYHEAALAESDGRPAKPIPLPESTSKMDVARMDNFIEYIKYIGAQLGVEFQEE
jgi:hypothetical protein